MIIRWDKGRTEAYPEEKVQGLNEASRDEGMMSETGRPPISKQIHRRG